ncbi:hypothetical protein ADUPG1_006737, partial [Aduncisulcus paluster]
MDPKSSSESGQDIIQEVKPEFIHEGDESSSPIPRDSPNVKSPDITVIEAKNRTKEEGDEEYDQSSAAQKMMKGEYYWGEFTDISLPFSTSTPIKGAYICIRGKLIRYSPSHLIFSLTSSKGEKMVKKYEFSELEKTSWFFLPIDLSDVVLCEIKGKGRKKESFEDEEYFEDEESFKIDSLVFISRKAPEEIKVREAREKLWSEAQVVKSEGDEESEGRDSIPIPRDDPKLVDPSFSMVKCKDDSKSKESEEFDQSSDAQRMLKGDWFVRLSHLSIPFPSPSPMKGAYICVNEYSSSPSLLFTFTDCDGKKTFKKYEFTEHEPEHRYEWHFLPIDLDNVALCEIEGKGTWEEENSRYFAIHSLVFLKQRILLGTVEYIYEGDFSRIPIPRDDPTFISPDFTAMNAREKTENETDSEYSSSDDESDYHDFDNERQIYDADMSDSKQAMMKGEGVSFADSEFSHISIPFKSSTSIKCAHICVSYDEYFPYLSLIFTFTSSNGSKISYLYEFDHSEFVEVTDRWFELSIDLSDVISCDIKGEIKGDQDKWENFYISSLAFYREETDDEEIDREEKELLFKKQWKGVESIKPKFIKEASIDSIPIPRDDPSIIKPSFSDVTCKNEVCCKESEKYDQSLDAQKMLKGEGGIVFSHLSIPFQSLNSIKGAYISVPKDFLPALLFTFTLSNGKKISKKYEFTEDLQKSKYYFFLPIELPKVVLCEIQGEGSWEYENGRRSFQITSLIFIKGEEIPPLPSDSTKLIKPNSFTLTSSATMTPQCIIGHGGFGEVLLVKVEGIPIPCVLKKMLHEADERVVNGCQKEFKMQRKLFNNPKCFNRIPRPLYILDLLDADMKGVYGFIMEYCAGGSVSAFARSWCDDGKYVSDIGDADDSEDSDSSCISDSDSKYNIGTTHFDPMTLNPVKVCSLCVGMIECLDDVFRAKKDLVHRDVKPDNFLVRVDPKDGECTVVLSDLGMVQVLDSITSSVTSKSYIPSSSSTKQEKRLSQPKPSA